jgi:hypothetical protein
VEQEGQLLAWEEMLQHKEATLAKDEIVIRAQKTQVEEQLRAAHELPPPSTQHNDGALTPRLPAPDDPPHTAAAAAAAAAAGSDQVQSSLLPADGGAGVEDGEGGGAREDVAGRVEGGGGRGKEQEKKARRAQILRLVGERDGAPKEPCKRALKKSPATSKP